MVDAHTLSDRVAQRGKFRVMEAVRIGIYLGRALAHAHSNGVVHGALASDDVPDSETWEICGAGYSFQAPGQGALPRPSLNRPFATSSLAAILSTASFACIWRS